MVSLRNVAIFIINYNGITLLKDLLYKCLDSFIRELKSHSSIDLWFIDNGSTDSSLDEVKARYWDRLKYLRLSRNLGYGAACNIAYEYTKRLGLRYKYYVCSNNDIEIYPRRLKQLLQWLNFIEMKYPRGFIAAPVFINGYDGFIDSGGFFVDEVGGTWPLRLVLLSKDRTKMILQKPILVGYSDGAFLIIHHKVIEDIGWFDPQFFLYYEDVELSLRAWSHGYPSILVPVILGVHYRSLTTKKMSIVPLYLNVRNRAFGVTRYMGARSILKLVLWYLSYIIRIPEARNTQLEDLVRKIIPGHIAFEPNNVSLLSLARYVIRALIEGIAMAMNNQKKNPGKAVDKSSPLHIGFADIFSQKKIIAKMQKQVKQHIMNTLILEN